MYAARDMEKHTMVIEYIGQLIRNEIAERNEAIYNDQVTHWFLMADKLQLEYFFFFLLYFYVLLKKFFA